MDNNNNNNNELIFCGHKCGAVGALHTNIQAQVM